jgi:uncharacterized damage-inducible protein DinB
MEKLKIHFTTKPFLAEIILPQYNFDLLQDALCTQTDWKRYSLHAHLTHFPGERHNFLYPFRLKPPGMNNIDLCQAYLAELKAESAATRKCLERIPDSVYSFKPHEKSMEMGYLTLLVAEIPKWISSMIKDSIIDFATYTHFKLSTTEKLLEHYDENIQGAMAALTSASENDLKKPFELKSNGKLLFSAPMAESIGSTLNHWVHHRGQLTVYMRLKDIAVPSIYGPSADEKTY